MLSARLVKMIENHAQELTQGVVSDLQANPKTPSYHQLSREALHQRVHEVFRDFGQWLEYKPDETMGRWYSQLGERRCSEGIRLGEVAYALTLTKYHLLDYIRAAGLVDSAMELYQEMELIRLVNRFFDKAVYYCVEGYMREAASNPDASGLRAGATVAAGRHR